MKKWITKKGEELEISNMDTSHIKNCINKIKTTGWRKDWLPILEDELKRRFLVINVDVKDLDITKEEMEHFILLDGGYEKVDLDIDNLEKSFSDRKAFEFVRDNTFYAVDKDEFLEKLNKNIKSKNFNYSDFKENLLENKFSELWTTMISIMLGRIK